MKLKSFLTVAFILIAGYSFGQNNILNATTVDELYHKSEGEITAEEEKKPLEYGYISNRDILWAKTVWEYIDLNQRVNFPLLFPVDTGQIGQSRKSLYNVLVDNVKDGTIENIYADSYFTRKRSFEELEATLHRRDTLDIGFEQINAGEELSEEYVDRIDVDGNDVQGFRIRGYWYFDKRQGGLRYRLLGLAPMVIGATAKAMGTENPEPVELFWVFYPEVRDVLFRAEVFNEDNTAQPFNFDQILNARRFSAVIYKEDNDYGDREIDEYIGENAMSQLLEAQRIKEEIREFEANMWNY